MTTTIVSILQSAPTRWLAAIGWTLLLSLLLLQPEADPLIDLGLPGGQSLWREVLFSALHLLAFALTCVLWFWTLRSAHPARKRLLAAALIAVALGIVTEALQSLTPDRHASLIDLLANIGGVLIAARLLNRRNP
jgi:VanZ family protein